MQLKVAQPEDLPFSPLVLVSASQPSVYERKACPIITSTHSPAPGRCLENNERSHRKPCHSPESGSLSNPTLGPSYASSRFFAIGASRGCLSSGGLADENASDSGDEEDCGGATKAATARAVTPVPPEPHQRSGGRWTYVYVPGAGDDEESWAAGLTPEIFWPYVEVGLRLVYH